VEESKKTKEEEEKEEKEDENKNKKEEKRKQKKRVKRLIVADSFCLQREACQGDVRRGAGAAAVRHLH
jgi:hypothetical protein